MKENKLEKQSRDLQENLIEYFIDTDDETFVGFIDSFVYGQPAKNDKVSKLAEKFIEDNGLFKAIANEKWDNDHPDRYLNRSALSETDLLYSIRISLISLSHNRFRKNLNKKNKKTNNNKKNFDYVKRQLLECYESLNRGESYFYGEEEDKKFVEKIENIKFK